MQSKRVLIIGAGISSATVANVLATQYGFSVDVLEARPQIGGNVATEDVNGILVHKYGAHIFHTDKESVWEFVNRFAKFNTYRHHVIALSDGEIIPLPFSMFTFNAIWPDVTTPQQARDRIKQETTPYLNVEPANLEEQALKLVGPTIYEKLIRTYTEKQWGRDCKDIPASVIQRIPLRFTYDSNYFFDRFQGIPEKGYSEMVKNMLRQENIYVEVNRKITSGQIESLRHEYDEIIFTGAIDELLDYELGVLEYRSLEFVHDTFATDNKTGHSVVNITDESRKYTRTIEHRHFMQNCKSDETIVTREFPREWKQGDERYYPVGGEPNRKLHEEYVSMFQEKFGDSVHLLGRLAEYKYYDMDDSIEAAINLADNISTKYR